MSSSRVWGSFDVYPAHYGIARYRLVVFPPGLSADERRTLRVWRAWPAWGAALWLALQVIGALVGMSETALIGGTMIYIAAGALAFAFTDDLRGQVRTLRATRMAGYGHGELDERYSRVRVLARALDRADLDLAEGRISTTEHEARWWRVYDEMAEVPATAVPAHAA